MSRRCLICSNLNPCSVHSSLDQLTELDRNDQAIAEIRARSPRPESRPKKRASYDSECLVLARHFLADTATHPGHHERVPSLAQAIQDAVEDWFLIEAPHG